MDSSLTPEHSVSFRSPTVQSFPTVDPTTDDFYPHSQTTGQLHQSVELLFSGHSFLSAFRKVPERPALRVEHFDLPSPVYPRMKMLIA